MQKTDEIRERLHNDFRPFDLRLSDGRVFHVAHPDFIAIGRRDVLLVTPDDRSHLIDSLHIVSIETQEPR